ETIPMCISNTAAYCAGSWNEFFPIPSRTPPTPERELYLRVFELIEDEISGSYGGVFAWNDTRASVDEVIDLIDRILEKLPPEEEMDFTFSAPADHDALMEEAREICEPAAVS